MPRSLSLPGLPAAAGHNVVTSRRALGLHRTKQRRYRAVYVDGAAIIDEGVIIGGRMMAGEGQGGPCACWRACDELVRCLHQLLMSFSHANASCCRLPCFCRPHA